MILAAAVVPAGDATARWINPIGICVAYFSSSKAVVTNAGRCRVGDPQAGRKPVQLEEALISSRTRR
jgi:hypothetical protein